MVPRPWLVRSNGEGCICSSWQCSFDEWGEDWPRLSFTFLMQAETEYWDLSIWCFLQLKFLHCTCCGFRFYHRFFEETSLWSVVELNNGALICCKTLCWYAMLLKTAIQWVFFARMCFFEKRHSKPQQAYRFKVMQWRYLKTIERALHWLN